MIIRFTKMLFREEEKESNNYYQSNIPQSISMDVPLHFSNFINSHLSTSTPSYSWIEESKDTKVFNISRTKSNSVEKLDKINHSPREKFTPFSVWFSLTIIRIIKWAIWLSIYKDQFGIIMEELLLQRCLVHLL